MSTRLPERRHGKRLQLVAIGGVLALIASVALSAGAAQADTPTRCGLATQINVRGTGAAGGTGTGRVYTSGGSDSTLNALSFQKNLETQLPVFEEQLNYPAIALQWPNPQTNNYFTSVQTGITNLVGEINNLNATCPYTNILLAGYSQGADVIEQSIGAYHQSVYAVPAVTASAFANINTVILFGDPDYRPSETWDASGDGTGAGVLEKPAGQLSSITNAIPLPPDYSTWGTATAVRSYCLTGDMFCQSNIAGLSIHQSYISNTAIMSDASSFVDSWLGEDY
jgi:hypothetical protein